MKIPYLLLSSTLALTVGTATAQTCFNDPLGAPQGAADDTLHNFALGFGFQFPGGTVATDITVDSNGRIFPINSDTSDFTDTVAEFETLEALIPYWDDLTGGTPADDLYISTDGVGRAVIQFNDFRRLSETAPVWSMTVILDGTTNSFSFAYDNRFPTGNHDAMVGFSDGVTTGTTEIDISSAIGAGAIDTGASGTAYEFFNVEPFDLGGFKFDHFPNGSGGYTIVPSGCGLATVQDLDNACNFAQPPSPPPSISRFQDGVGGYVVTPGSGMTFDPNIGASVNPTDDSISTVALGFAFTMPGGTQVTDIDIDSNGRIMQVGADLSDFTPSVGEMLGAVGATINPFHVDLNATLGGDVSFFTDNVSKARITWNSPQFGSAPGLDLLFQLQLEAGMPGDPNDDFWTAIYENVTNYSSAASALAGGNSILIGCSAGNGAADPGETDVSVSVVTGGVPNQYEFFDDNIPEPQDLQTGGGFQTMSYVANSLPQIGGMFDTVLDGIPATATFGAIGIGGTNLNAPLGMFFMGNPCTLNSSLELATPPITIPGPSALTIDLTTAGTNIAGLTLVFQGVVADFSAPVGVLPIITSNALLVTFGF